MVELATATNPGDRIPYADVLVNVGKPSLSSVSDEPVIDLTKPQEEAEAEVVDNKDNAPDTADTSAKVEGEGDGPPQPDEGKEAGEGKDKTSPQQRAAFARERNKRQAAEQERQALQTQLAQLTETVAKLVGERDQPKDDPRPTRETFTDPEAYDNALVDWSGRQASAKAKAEAQQEQVQQDRVRQFETLRDSYNERVAAFEEQHPDFDDVFSEDVKVSAVMTQALLEAEDGPAIAYYLGQNPEVAERITGLSPAKQVYEIGRISAKLAAPPPPKPAPIKPLAARNNSGPKDPNEMTMEEYAAHRASSNRKAN
jgi:hypothetical protein